MQMNFFPTQRWRQQLGIVIRVIVHSGQPSHFPFHRMINKLEQRYFVSLGDTQVEVIHKTPTRAATPLTDYLLSTQRPRFLYDYTRV